MSLLSGGMSKNSGSSSFTPLQLFYTANGAWFKPNVISTVFQDTAGSTPVTAVEQTVGRLTDQSGLGNHTTQSTAGYRPKLSARTNVWQYTEEFSSNRYSTTNATKQSDSIVWNGITLTRISTTQYYSQLYSNISGLGLHPFVTGNRYLISTYVKSATEQFMMMRGLVNTSSNGHGAKLITTTPRRIWMLIQATADNAFTMCKTPSTALGGETGSSFLYWLNQCSTEGGSGEVYIGGFQIDLVPSNYVDGIALIGDSTMLGSSGFADYMLTTSREVSTWLGAMLNVNVFNRAIGGQRLDQMDARWTTDITPLAVNCKYVVIQGGLNDIGQGYDLQHCKDEINSMVSKATTDGLLPVIFTASPTVGISAVPAQETIREQLNAWILSTFPRTVDIASVLADPNHPTLLNPLWVGDGTHYVDAGKKVAGQFAASASFWNFLSPKVYQKVTGVSTYNSTGFTTGLKYDLVDDVLTIASMPSGTYTMMAATGTGVTTTTITQESTGAMNLPVSNFTEAVIVNQLQTTGQTALTTYLSKKVPF